MRLKQVLLFISIISTILLNAQNLSKDGKWDLLLSDVKIKYFYSIKYNALLPRPKFGDELKELNGQTIVIRGFFLPVDITGNIFVISYNPMNMCFFCTGEGVQSIVELNVLPEHLRHFKRLKTDDYFEVKGKLKLNAHNYEHLIYVLDDVEFVKLIR